MPFMKRIKLVIKTFQKMDLGDKYTITFLLTLAAIDIYILVVVLYIHFN